VRPARDDPHTLAGAYVLDALDAADEARFSRHLAGCDSCRQEVRGLREAAAALAGAAAVTPRAALRDAVLQAAARTRQLPPAVTPEPASRRHRRWWRPPLLARAGVRRLALGLTCVIAAAAVALGVVSYAGLQHRLDQAQGRDHLVASVLSAPDASMFTGHVSTGGTVTVVMSHRMGMLVVTAADLRVLPASQHYELWLMGPEGSRPAGMIDDSGRDKMSSPMVVSGLAAGDRVGLTVEPAGGSPRPTSRPVLLLALTGGAG
jgi:anti-sigma-K factor RskA